MINRLKNILKKRKLKRIANYRDIDGWLTDNEALGLYNIARKLPKQSHSLEIGSWQGKSSYCISKGIKDGKLTVIDPFNASGGFDIASEKEYQLKTKEKGETTLLESFKYNMNNLGVLNKIIVKKGYSYDFDDEIGALDFLFIDGDHSVEGCKKDYELYSDKVKKGGFIAFHDFDESRLDLGPTYVVNNYVLKSSGFSFYGLYDSLWVGIRNKNIND